MAVQAFCSDFEFPPRLFPHTGPVSSNVSWYSVARAKLAHALKEARWTPGLFRAPTRSSKSPSPSRATFSLSWGRSERLKSAKATAAWNSAPAAAASSSS
eukprot:CAMPEP_0194671856 /NCGR_PEP_ID=MMETSP0295-20121207/6080_1 /TAXON_ID=39354 /ORGANISM="Heterosigma akashiwo, Strain CCMP2393" /LENGTH=99 /DNA_ID=CAMNT_0039555417 /DNA_START=405 /DNA_END=701 /DNA_ORIENTATION=-